jgi:hypothetical protein
VSESGPADGSLVPEVITDLDEVLFRQVHPIHLDDGVLSSAAFIPGRGHNGKLSTLRNRVGAEEAHRRWTSQPGHESCGTWGISVGEAAAISLPTLADETLPDMPDAHASIDFENCASKGEISRSAKKLRNHATDRRRLYPEERLL